MENGEISDTKISASSEYDSYHSANEGRLHFKATGDKGGTWGARLPDANQWLQVDLGTECFILTRVATQGGNRYLAWVREYHLEFVSNAGRNFQYYRERGSTNKMVFIGNNDSNSVVAHDLKPPIEARYVRFRPLVWHHWVSMRVELYGCSKVCPLYWKPFGNLRYAIFTTERSWSDGEAFCNSLGARLVKITSDDESAFVNSILPGNYPSDKPYWIGLCEDEPNKKWKWSDGSELGVYTNWKEDEPNQFQDILACTVLVGGEWRDRQCSDKYFFICEK
ncbi:retinoschisin-like [Stylophora pistillata]|nr:retinoschisin-like [Stylophora pistillata]